MHLGAACEDGHYTGYLNSNLGGQIMVDTTAGRFLPPNRCGLSLAGNSSPAYLLKSFAPQSQFWAGFRCFLNAESDCSQDWILFSDASSTVRLAANMSATGSIVGPFRVYKVSAAGARTLLFTTSGGISAAPGTPNKVDWNIDYSTTGGVSVWVDGTLVGSCSNTDVTTDGATELAGIILGNPAFRGGVTLTYSGLDLDTESTLGHDTFFRPPATAGDVDQWTGGVANVGNETASSTVYDTVTTADQVQLYKPGVAIPAGKVVKVVDIIQATQGVAPALTNVQFLRSIGGTVYNSANVPLPTSEGVVENVWEVSPASGVAFTVAELNDPAYQIGYESEA